MSEPAARAPSPAPTDLRFEYRDSAGVHAVKEFHLTPDSYVITFRGDVTDGRARRQRRRSCGGRPSATSPKSSRYVQTAEGLLFRRTARCADRGKGYRQAADARGRLPYAGVDDNYFMTVALDPRREQGDVPGGDDSAAGRLARMPAASWSPTRSSPDARTSPSSFSPGPRTSTCWPAIDPGVTAAIDFGILRRHRRAAPAIAEVGERLRRATTAGRSSSSP